MHDDSAPTVDDLRSCFALLAKLHVQLCPRQVLGVRMGLYAGGLLDVDVPASDRRLLTILERDGCFADAVSVATGCSVGRRSLRVFDFGKAAVTVVDLQTKRAVRLRPHRLARARAAAYGPAHATAWQVQLGAYQVMPAEDLLSVQWVRLTFPIATLSRPGVRTLCAQCGEEVSNLHVVHAPGRDVCRGCAGERYYVAVPRRQVA